MEVLLIVDISFVIVCHIFFRFKSTPNIIDFSMI